MVIRKREVFDLFVLKRRRRHFGTIVKRLGMNWSMTNERTSVVRSEYYHKATFNEVLNADLATGTQIMNSNRQALSDKKTLGTYFEVSRFS